MAKKPSKKGNSKGGYSIQSPHTRDYWTKPKSSLSLPEIVVNPKQRESQLNLRFEKFHNGDVRDNLEEVVMSAFEYKLKRKSIEDISLIQLTEVGKPSVRNVLDDYPEYDKLPLSYDNVFDAGVLPEAEIMAFIEPIEEKKEMTRSYRIKDSKNLDMRIRKSVTDAFPKKAHLFFNEAKTILENDLLAQLIAAEKVLVSSEENPELVQLYCERLQGLAQKKSKTLPHKPHKKIIENANEYALSVGEKIHELHQQGKLTLEEKAEALDDAGIPTRRGKAKWDSTSVRNIYLRWQELTGNKVDIANTYSNKSEEFAKKIGPILEEMTEEGFITYQAKADELNKRQIKTFRGNLNWNPSSVLNIERKYDKIKPD